MSFSSLSALGTGAFVGGVFHLPQHLKALRANLESKAATNSQAVFTFLQSLVLDVASGAVIASAGTLALRQFNYLRDSVSPQDISNSVYSAGRALRDGASTGAQWVSARASSAKDLYQTLPANVQTALPILAVTALVLTVAYNVLLPQLQKVEKKDPTPDNNNADNADNAEQDIDPTGDDLPPPPSTLDTPKNKADEENQ